MTSLKLHTRTESFYKWSDIEHAVEEVTHRSIRDWAGKFKNNDPTIHIPYQDFWHKLVAFVDIRNGAIEMINFEDMRDCFAATEAETWINEVIDVIVSLIGKEEIPILFYW